MLPDRIIKLANEFIARVAEIDLLEPHTPTVITDPSEPKSEYKELANYIDKKLRIIKNSLESDFVSLKYMKFARKNPVTPEEIANYKTLKDFSKIWDKINTLSKYPRNDPFFIVKSFMSYMAENYHHIRNVQDDIEWFLVKLNDRVPPEGIPLMFELENEFKLKN